MLFNTKLLFFLCLFSLVVIISVRNKNFMGKIKWVTDRNRSHNSWALTLLEYFAPLNYLLMLVNSVCVGCSQTTEIYSFIISATDFEACHICNRTH